MANTLPGTTFRTRPSGNDLNGGGFDSSYGGFDYSNQNAPQLTFTGGVGNALTGTTGSITLLGAGFASDMVGNIVNIISGTNFLAGRYKIVTFNSSSSVDLDRTPCPSGNGSGGAGRVGGAFLSFKQLIFWVGEGDHGIMNNGTYTQTAFLNGGEGGATSLTFQKTLWAESVGGVTVQFNLNTASFGGFTSVAGYWFDGIIFTTTGNNFAGMGGTSACIWTRCKWQNCVLNGNVTLLPGSAGGYDMAIFEDCLFDNITWASPGSGTISYCIGSLARLTRCVIRNIARPAIRFMSQAYIENCIFYNISTTAIYADDSNPQSVVLRGCIFYNITGDAILTGNSQVNGRSRYQVDKCIFWGCTGSGIATSLNMGGTYCYWLTCNAGGNNGANYDTTRIVSNVFNFVTLTADPFVDAPNGNFALNSTEGGGNTVAEDTDNCYGLPDIGWNVGCEPPAGIDSVGKTGTGIAAYGWCHV